MCIHAEQLAIAEAAARGVCTKGAAMYINLRPCLACLATIQAAGLRAVIFEEDWTYPDEFESAYQALASTFDVFGALVQVGDGLDWHPYPTRDQG